MKLRCVICGVFFRRKQLDRHLRADHWVCPQCDRVIATREGLRSHRRWKHDGYRPPGDRNPQPEPGIDVLGQPIEPEPFLGFPAPDQLETFSNLPDAPPVPAVPSPHSNTWPSVKRHFGDFIKSLLKRAI